MAYCIWGGGGCYGGVLISQIILPLKSQISKKNTLQILNPNFVTPQIPNPYFLPLKSQIPNLYLNVIKAWMIRSNY